jgi:hypothetical protein
MVADPSAHQLLLQAICASEQERLRLSKYIVEYLDIDV